MGWLEVWWGYDYPGLRYVLALNAMGIGLLLRVAARQLPACGDAVIEHEPVSTRKSQWHTPRLASRALEVWR